MWLPTQSSLNMGTAFLQPNSMSTLTIPSTASLAVTVAAYDARTFSYADFSGRGTAGMYEGRERAETRYMPHLECALQRLSREADISLLAELLLLLLL